MRIVAIFLFLLMMMVACNPAKKIQNTEPVLSTPDTTSVVVATDNHTSEAASEGNKPEIKTAVNDVLSKVLKNKIDFSTFNAKVRVKYAGTDGGDEATAFVRIKKDSAIWFSLRGPLGVEGFRVLITKDSVKVMNLLKKNVQYKSIDYLQELADIPLDFTAIQDIVIGNPVFIDSNVVSHEVNANNQLLVLMAGNVFKHLLSLDNSDYKILHSKLDDVDASRSRTCNITFGDYENTSGFLFSKAREISVTEQSKLDINLDFKQYSFNQSLTFPFNIPKNYKRL